MRRYIICSSRASCRAAWNFMTRCPNFYGFYTYCLYGYGAQFYTAHSTTLFECCSDFKCGLRQLKPRTFSSFFLRRKPRYLLVFFDIQGLCQYSVYETPRSPTHLDTPNFRFARQRLLAYLTMVPTIQSSAFPSSLFS